LALSHALLFAEVGELLSFEVGKLYLSSHKEADDLGFRLGARAHPATHARSPYLAAKPAIKFFTGVEKHLHRLHRLACPARLHASQTEVGRFFDRSNTGSYFYSGIIWDVAAASKKQSSERWYDFEMMLATKNEGGLT
jgi:hypothetical protein